MVVHLDRDDAGFSLVELTVVLLVMSVLMVIGMASYARMAHLADDEATQLDLVTAVKVQILHQFETGAFTEDPHVLFDLEPSLRYSADGADGSVVVRIEPAHAATDVCVFAVTRGGDWYGIHHSAVSADRYGVSAPIACTPAATAAWPTESW